jgi:hypothetical protein
MRTDSVGQSALLLLDAVDILIHEKVAYAVIGAMAASVHGVVRASLDADAVLALSPKEMRSLEPRFREAEFRTEFRPGNPDDPIPAMLVLTDDHGNRVDLLAGLRGMEPAAFSRALVVSFFGKPLSVVGCEDFIAMKVFAGGPVDMDDARNALAVAGDAIDADLLRRVTRNYGPAAEESLETLLPR